MPNPLHPIVGGEGGIKVIIMITIENWSCVGQKDPYLPPEALCISLQGNVYGHPSFMDGDEVVTTPVISAKGLNVRVASGRVYILGKVSDEYREWLEQNRPNWDKNNPITKMLK